MAFSIFIQSANSTAEHFNVRPNGEEIIILRLEVEDHISVKFTVVGTIDFEITNPNHGTMVEFAERGNVDYSFVCEQAGNYTLHFRNKDSSEDKLVTLNYEIQHYIFGIPQMLFLTIIITVFCIGAVATFTLMGKPR
jgi:hypothetical protein